MRFIRAVYVLLLLAAAAVPAAAQQDILTGRVTQEDGKPVIGARVEVISAETEISRSVVTDANGRYMIIFPDGGGRYVMRVTFLGMADFVQAVVRNDTEELLLTNVTMRAQAITLDAISVTAQRPPPSQGNTGENSTALPQELLARLPLPDLDPATLALLAAGVVGTGADSLSGRMGFSVGGMSDLLNQITLDGVVLGADGALGVPEEGVRRTQVTTSTFDASRGGFAGGQVSMQTARGNNRNGGALTYRFDDDALQMSSAASSNPFTRHNLGGSWGGPIISNKLFYNTSFQLSQNTNYRFALSPADPLAALRSGVATDSIQRFVGILQNGHGFEDVLSQTGAYSQPNADYRIQGRVDWNLLQRQGTSQTLSLSYNTNINDQQNTRISTLDLMDHGGDSERNSQLARLSLASRWGTNWTNNLSLSFSENWSEQLPYDTLPEGRVRVTSEFGDGTRATNTLVFGGNRSMPTEAYSRDIQLSDDLSFLLPVGAQIHRLKVGGNLQLNKDVSRSTNNLFGSFTFASLDDFAANRPESYTRALQERNSRTGAFNGGVYVGDTWRVSMPLEVTLGLRYDYSKLDQKPDYNPLIEQVFGRRTDITPDAWSLSPRVGFNYRLNQQGQPAKTISGGLGMFAGRSPISVYSTAVRQTGLPGAEQSLTCIGDATPIPDWDLYASNPGAVPQSCLDGSPGMPDPFSQRAPTVTLIDPDQALPSSVRADIGYRTQLPKGFTGNFRYTYSLGMGLWGYRDLNLNETQTFTLAGENRTFFGDPSAIVPESGASSMVRSRNDTRFGNVWDVVSDLESKAHQVTAQVSGMLPPKLFMNLNYTLGFAEDQGSGSFGQATTAGNPNVSEWATSSNDRRHTLNMMLSYAAASWLEVSANARLSSGTPFTPMVNRDINGDGVRNDRAFVFDPATADANIAAGMARLMATVPDGVRDCLQSQAGRIAERNSCRNSWTESLDMRLSLRPNLPTLERRLTLSLDTRNMLTGLDEIVNGKNSMKGWGEGARADGNLLEVQGFDAANNRYIYQVNEGFGQTNRGPNSFRAPFSLTLSGRIAIGGQPQMNNRAFGQGGFPGMGGFGGGGMGGMGGGRGDFGGGPGGFPGGAGGIGEMMALFRGGVTNVDSLLATQLANPLAGLAAMKDSLALTEPQLAAVTKISTDLDAQLVARRDTLKPVIETMMRSGMQGGGNPQQLLQQVQLQIQPHLDGARRETGDAARAVQRELSAEQWAKVPAPVRAAAQPQQQRGAFNAVGMLDRMLANPIAVLLELKTQLAMTPDQVTQVEKISNDLQVRLAQRREELGRRFDNVQGQQQMQVFQQLQPEIERTRKEVTDALAAVQKVLNATQWGQVPEQVRNPFTQQQRGGRGPGGE